MPVLGLDLARWWADVRRIVLAKFGRYIRAEGLDPDDVLGEVAKRIVVANAGSSPYDPRRSDPPSYVCLVAGSAIRDLRRQARRWGREWPECPARDGDRPAEGLTDDTTLDRVVDTLLGEAELADADRAIVRLYVEGHPREEIVVFTGASRTRVIGVIARVRRAAAVAP